MSPWRLMLLPFLECLVLVGIHSYLGIHVIKRKVIFVDLALAQIAALGTIVAFLFGIEPQSIESYVFSLLFTFLGAAVFSLTRLREERIPQEAVIGLVYALTAAVGILIIDRAPHGAEHIKEVLTGTILWVRWQAVAVAAGVYAAVGVFHYIFRERFLLISNDPAEAYRQGINVRLWDFLFYMSFGLVITLSVNTAGVLLVFVFLVVPAIMAISITSRLVHQLLIGWGAGTAVSLIGLWGSYALDFPSGPAVVTVYGAALLVVALVLFVVRARRRIVAASQIGIGIGMVALVTIVFHLLGNWLGPDLEAGHIHPDDEIHQGHRHGAALEGEIDQAAPSSVKNRAHSLLDRISRVDITQRSPLLARETDTDAMELACAETDDEELKVAIARRLLEREPRAGRRILIEMLNHGELPLFRSEALEALTHLSGDDFGFKPLEDPASAENREALSRWEHWRASKEDG